MKKSIFKKSMAFMAFFLLLAGPLLANAGAAAGAAAGGIPAVIAGGAAFIAQLKKDDGTEFSDEEKEILKALGKLNDHYALGLTDKEHFESEKSELLKAHKELDAKIEKLTEWAHKQAQKTSQTPTPIFEQKNYTIKDVFSDFLTTKSLDSLQAAFGQNSRIKILDGEVATKAPTNMMLSTNAGGNVYGLVSSEIDTFNDLRRNANTLWDVVVKRATNSKLIKYFYKSNPEGNAQMTAEGGVKPLVDFEITEGTSVAKKVAAAINVNTEMLEDIDFIATEIDTELMYQVYRELCLQLRSGTNTATTLLGLSTIGVPFSLTTMSVTNPNVYDAMIAVITQGKTLNHNINVFVINPIDMANLKLSKGTDGHYTFMGKDGTSIGGITIVEDNDQAIGSFIAFDRAIYHVRPYKGLTIEMDRNGNDFRENRITIIAEMRLHTYVKANDIGGIIDDTFANVIAAL